MTKPYTHIRKAQGYCCERCDGPYAKYKKNIKRSLKRSDKNQIKKDIKDAQRD